MKKLVMTLNMAWNIYNYRLGLLEALQKDGFEIFAVAPKDKYSDKIPYTFVDWRLQQRGKNPLKEMDSYLHLKSIYQKIQPDIALHFTIKSNIYGTLAGHALGIPSICNVNGLGESFQKGSGIFQMLITKLYLHALRKSSKIFFQNNIDSAHLLSLAPELNSKSGILPGSGINIEKFNPTSKVFQKPYTFLMASRLFKEKGVEEYIRAAEVIKRKYPETRFLLIGDIYTQRDEVLTRTYLEGCTQRGIIEYLGMQDDVKNFIHQCDCVVLPTYYREGCPRVLIEAASCAVPIITTNHVGCVDVVDDGYNGLLCEKQSVESLVEKIEAYIILDDLDKKQMGLNGRQKVIDKFNEELIIENYLNAIHSILR